MYTPPSTISAKAINLISEISAQLERFAIRMGQATEIRLRKVNRMKTIRGSLAWLVDFMLGVILDSLKLHNQIKEDLSSKLPGKLPSKLELTYKAICEDRYASNKELAERTGQSERTIRNHTAKLKELHLIRRVGSDKTGSWEVLTHGERN